MGDKGNLNAGDSVSARRFAAFISYSHADAEVAAQLQRRLERYRLPKRISQMRQTPTSALGAIFRDREDLAAAASLSAAIRDAIARAEALIVICSPDAAKSDWVSAEIELFRELHPEKPILAALVAGEPASSFPSALTKGGIEPLAADLRPNADGPQLGFLKIVAGIAGIQLDALIQRDAQRRIRRVTSITVGALAAMLIMGIMTAYALKARNDAARQRAEAEGLVEYMLTDLRQKLKGVGRLDVMDAVNQRAMDYYGRQGDLRELPEDGLERRARLLHAMGEDDEKRGNLHSAIQKFGEAHRTTQALLKRQPDNPERIFAHAQSEYWVGYAALQNDDFERAGKAYRKYAQFGNRLAQMGPQKALWQMEAGYGQQNLGTLLIQQGIANDVSTQAFKTAAHYFTKAIALQPSKIQFHLDLAEAEAWLADSYALQQQYGLALAARTRQKQILEQLARVDPENADYQQRLLLNAVATAQLEMDSGKPSEAATTLRQAHIQSRRAVTRDPTNAELVVRARGVGLLFARALLLSRSQSTRAIADLMAPCNDNKLVEDERLMCATNRVRAYHARGNVGEAQRALTQTKAIFSEIKQDGRRLRWGMDFDREIASLEKLLEEQ
ncbi:MAG: TIR domain-containing protein [Sphingomonadaceae bacterium]|nr:TIR domain-containing protein [Sphingomonadaceae bacterium]